MAKSKSFFGVRSGSTKSHTYQSYRGEQITKDRVTEVSNPQTSKQMQQRLIVPLVASARSSLNGLVNHSFEGIDYGWKSLQEFSSVNTTKGALTVQQYVPKGAMDCGLANFVISRGTLPNLDLQIEGMDADNSGHFVMPLLNANGALDVTSLELFIYQVGVAVFNTTGIEGEVQISFLHEIEVKPSYTWTAAGASYENSRHGFVLSRLIVYSSKQRDESTFKAWNDRLKDLVKKNTQWSYIAAGDNKANFTDGYTFFEVNYTQTSGSKGSQVATIFVQDRTKNAPTEAEGVCAGAVILSQETNTKWKRSSNRLQMLTQKTIDYAACEPSYKKNASESDRYLNFGSDATYIPGTSYEAKTAE